MYYMFSEWFAIIFKQGNEHNYAGMSNCMKEGLDSIPLSRSETMIDLEFTLGRPTWQTEHAEPSRRELTLLKC